MDVREAKAWEIVENDDQCHFMDAEQRRRVVDLMMGFGAETPEFVTMSRIKWDAMVKFFDEYHGTPCEQIRHHDEIVKLTAHAALVGRMPEDVIARMTPAQASNQLRLLKVDALARLGADEKWCADWLSDYSEGRI